MSIDERLDRIETAVSELAARLARLEGARSRSAGEARPPGSAEISSRPAPPAARANSFASKTTEWWLARGGAVLTCFSLILLYQYAVEHNWITPLVRVVAGTGIGAALFVGGQRTTRRPQPRDIGMREVLVGAALAAWYITAYAAAVFYSIIPFSAARVLFLLLTVLGAWLALSEAQSILGFLALAVGFATPLLLPTSSPSIPVFSIYLGSLAAIGSILYLMRGWQAILWLTFICFWMSAGNAAQVACCAFRNPAIHLAGTPIAAQLALSALIFVAALAFMRVPTLRRSLIETGSHLYTAPSGTHNTEQFQRQTSNFVTSVTGRDARDDSALLWSLILFSPLIAIMELNRTLIGAPLYVWGVLSLLAGAIAWRVMVMPRDADSEVTHVLAAAVALWTLTGTVTLAWAIARYPLNPESTGMMAACIHALVVIEIAHHSRYRVPRRIAIATAAFVLCTVLFSEAIASTAVSSIDGQWLIAELGAVALAIWIWVNRTTFEAGRAGTVMGAGAYLSLMLIDARTLGRVWPPLVTASYAVAGAALLVYARGAGGTRTMRRLGSITLIVVVARLVLVDLAQVETIWRVLLFLGCGALFLLTSYRLQSTERSTPPEQAA